jgi:hypothetical protein
MISVYIHVLMLPSHRTCIDVVEKNMVTINLMNSVRHSPPLSARHFRQRSIIMCAGYTS